MTWSLRRDPDTGMGGGLSARVSFGNRQRGWQMWVGSSGRTTRSTVSACSDGLGRLGRGSVNRLLLRAPSTGEPSITKCSISEVNDLT